ncbi:ribosomal-protein-alanine N-acetyltransferase [Roseovarius marisflavi]|uniref:Ribosomal-protein-alanine N-acetyltransferase n=2 Tax=Roseovarius marisflavi TaxID=1054996 RepID=A0A1M7A678_9RHOB|nr:ribosomal-protein-alanine N-acetyltransferase [Roseovarius marisflavi]
MTPEDMARTHARAFADTSRGWSAQEIADLLQSPLVFALGDARAFALGRAIADEAELLTLATDPDHRRKGLARACLAAFEASAQARGARTAFLEVAADNAEARALYDKAGYGQTARRKGYYARRDSGPVDALILQKSIP